MMSVLEWYHRKDNSTYALVYLSEKSELYNSMFLVPPWSAGRKKKQYRVLQVRVMRTAGRAVSTGNRE